MPEETPILNFNDAINALNSVSDSFKIEVWIPSLQKNISFKEIDAKQQKAILGHPQLKRILNMDEMISHPMRKEFPMEDAGRTDKDDRFFGRTTINS